MTTIIELFKSEGELHNLASATPLVEQAEFVWCVASGYADLFLQITDSKSQTPGELRTLFRVKENEFFLGLDADVFPPGYRRVVHASHDATFYRLSKKRFYALFKDPVFAEEAEALLQGLVEKQCRPRKQYRFVPKKTTTMTFGKMEMSEGQHVYCDEALCWLKVEEGNVCPLSVTTVALLPGAISPFATGAWLTAIVPSKISVVKTNTLTEAELAQGVLELQKWVVASWLMDLPLVNSLRQTRAHAKQTLDEKEVRGGLTRLASVLEADEAPMTLVTRDLLAACQKIGQILNITFVPLSEADQALPSPYAKVQRLARAAHVRCREVQLVDEWWTAEEPLLVFTKDGQHPCALLPKSSGGYEVYHPETQETISLQPAMFDLFEKKAVMFYEPFAEQFKPKGLWNFAFQGTRRDIFRVMSMSIFAGILALLLPYTYALLLNQIIPDANVRSLGWLVLVLIVSAIVSAGFFLMRGMAVVRLEGRSDQRLQAALWDRLLKLPVDFFRHYSTGDLAMRALGFFRMRAIISSTVVMSILSAIFGVLYLVMMFTYNIPLSLLAMLLLLVLFGVMFFAAKRMLGYTLEQTRISGKLAGFVLQLLTGIAKLRAMGAERRAFARWAVDYAEQQRNEFKSQMIWNVISAINAAFPALVSLVIFAGVVAWWEHAPGFTTGAFLTFNTALMSLVLAVMMMESTLLGAINVVPFYRRLLPILQAAPEVDDSKKSPGILMGRLSVKHVAFRYTPTSPWVLQDVSFEIAAGELVALVGYSGSGKSTLLRLLLGFEQASSGAIYYDDQNIAGLDIGEVRTQIGVVLQSGRLVPGSIFQNIVGSLPYTMDDAWQAARACGLAEEIEAMPMGMHTFVSEGAATLSGGQRQLILIARALISRPRLLFFDEATSALDNQTQAIVTKSLHELHATRVVIAHRLTTIKNADRILVLREGSIVETGTYAELMAKDGYFAELAKRQVV